MLESTALVVFTLLTGCTQARPAVAGAVLRDVYYVQTSADPQTEQVSNKVEPAGANSKAAQLIAKKERKK